MVLLLAKAAGCSWTTARELLVMYVANRSLQPDEITEAFERYRKLSKETARNIVNFYERRMKERSQRGAKKKAPSAQDLKQAASDEADIVEMPSPSLAPL